MYSALMYSLCSILINSGPKLLRYLNFYLYSIGNQVAEHHCRAEPGVIHHVQCHPEGSSQGQGPNDSKHCLSTAVVMEMFSEQALPKCKQIHSHK